MSLGSWDLGCFHPVGCSKGSFFAATDILPWGRESLVCVCVFVCVGGPGLTKRGQRVDGFCVLESSEGHF